MTTLAINKAPQLSGSVELSGDQKIIMAIQAASLMSTSGTVIVDNVPVTASIVAMKRLLQSFGEIVELDRKKNILKMDATHHITSGRISGDELITAGPLFARCRHIKLVDNGINPQYQKTMIQVTDGLRQLGADVKKGDGSYEISANSLKGSVLNCSSMTLDAKLTLLMVSSLTTGITVFNNVGKEPCLLELSRVLRKMGARVHGDGTDTIRVQGVSFLHSTDYYAMNDQNEAATYLMIGALTASDILVRGARAVHLKKIIDHLEKMGNTVISQHDGVRIIGTKLLLPIDANKKLIDQMDTYNMIALTALQMCAHGKTKLENINGGLFNIITKVAGLFSDQVHYSNNVLMINGPIEFPAMNLEVNESQAGLLALLCGLVANGTVQISPAEVPASCYAHFIDHLIEMGAQIELKFD